MYCQKKRVRFIGKVVNNIPLNLPDSLKSIKEPTIIIAHDEIIYGIENPNVVAIIAAPETTGGLGHIPSLLKNQTDLFGIVVRPEVLKELDKLNGKNVELELKDGELTFMKTNKKGKPRKIAPVKISRLKHCNKILSSEECTPDVIGGKAVNLRKLEIMAEEGKIDAIIPKFIALPWGWLEKYYIDEIIHASMDGDVAESDKLFKESNQYYLADGKMSEVVNILKEKGIGYNGLMIRSCFSDEDTPNLSNAGVYDSLVILGNNKPYNLNNLKMNIGIVLLSKYKKSGVSIRKYFNIADEDVQGGVILQDKIDSKNCFTIYTDDGNNNLIIDYRTNPAPKNSDDTIICPHLYTYNKKTGKLTYQTKQVRKNIGANFDENCRLKYSDPVEIDLTDDKKLNKRLKRAIDNALAVEKEFEQPQDIEGGFDKYGKLYFWQARNVVGLN